MTSPAGQCRTDRPPGRRPAPRAGARPRRGRARASAAGVAGGQGGGDRGVERARPRRRGSRAPSRCGGPSRRPSRGPRAGRAGRGPARARSAGPTPTRVPGEAGLVEQPRAEGVREREAPPARPHAPGERDLQVDAVTAQVAAVARARNGTPGATPSPTTTTTSGPPRQHPLDRIGAGPAQLGRSPASARPSTPGRSSGGDGQKATATVSAGMPAPAALVGNGGHRSSVPDATWDTAGRVEHGRTPVPGRSRPLRRLRRTRTRAPRRR